MAAALEQSRGAHLPVLYPEASVEHAVAACPSGARLVLEQGGKRLFEALTPLIADARDRGAGAPAVRQIAARIEVDPVQPGVDRRPLVPQGTRKGVRRKSVSFERPGQSSTAGRLRIDDDQIEMAGCIVRRCIPLQCRQQRQRIAHADLQHDELPGTAPAFGQAAGIRIPPCRVLQPAPALAGIRPVQGRGRAAAGSGAPSPRPRRRSARNGRHAGAASP